MLGDDNSIKLGTDKHIPFKSDTRLNGHCLPCILDTRCHRRPGSTNASVDASNLVHAPVLNPDGIKLDSNLTRPRQQAPAAPKAAKEIDPAAQPEEDVDGDGE